jgi:hypothetical protein
VTLRPLLAAALVLALVACGGEEPPIETVHTAVAYEHVPSGLVFPLEVGPFARTNVYPGRAGLDGVIVGYAHMMPTGPMLVTVTLEASPPATVQPATIDPACRQLFAQRKDDIAKSNAAVKWLEDKDVTLTIAGGSHPAMMTAFDYEFRGNPVRGFLFVTCHLNGKWTLHYRVTSPRDPQVGQAVAGFIAALPAQLAPAGRAEGTLK